MRIGYLRQNQFVELDFWNASASNLGTELRNGILEGFLKLGHEVTILSPIHKKHMHILNGEGEGFDYTVFGNLKYDPTGLPEDLDLLFIEAASTSTLFCYGSKKDDSIKPFVQRTMEVVGAHTGRTVVYHHGNHLLGFPFGEVGKPTEGLAANNLKVLVELANVWTNGKSWEIWHHATDDEAFRDVMNGIQRFSYGKVIREMGVKSKYIPMSYSPNFDSLNEVPRNPKYDLLYIGSARDANRMKKLLKYYAGQDWYDLKVGVIGDWSDAHAIPVPWTKDTFQPTNWNGIEFLGRQGGHGEVYSYYQDALATVQIADSQFEREGMVTTRVTQAIRAGVVLLADHDIPGMNAYVGDDYIVKTADHVTEKLQTLKAMSYEERCAIVAGQRANLKKWVDVLPAALEG